VDILSASGMLIDFPPVDGVTHYLLARGLRDMGDRDGALRTARLARETLPGDVSIEALCAANASSWSVGSA